MAPPTRAKTIDELSVILTELRTDMNSRFDALDRKISDVMKENKELRESNQRLSTELQGMRNHLNNTEQHQRNYSIRINNLQLPDSISQNPHKVRDFVYDTAIAPILRGAVELGDLPALPSSSSIIELAHILPGPDSKPRPIIARFFNRLDRGLVFKHKRQYAPRELTNSKRLRYPFYEDLTRDSFSLMRRLNADDRTESAWSVRGQIRFKLAGTEVVKKVDNVFRDYEEFFNP